MGDDSEDPISKLDKLFPNLQYNFKSKKGCLFTMSVEINNKIILGFGSTFKLAKKNAAEHALKYLYSSHSQVSKQDQEQTKSCKVKNFETNNNIKRSKNVKKPNARRVLFQNYESTNTEPKYLESDIGNKNLKNLNLHNKDLRNTNFECHLKVTSFKPKNQKNPNFEFRNPRNKKYEFKNFASENVESTNFECENFENAGFVSENTNFGWENFENKNFECGNLENMDFECENHGNRYFPSENPRNTNFLSENPRNTNFPSENPRNMNFPSENPRKTNFPSENPRNKIFPFENPRSTNFPSEHPRNTNFPSENLRNPNFECENPRNLNFECENPRNPNFECDNPRNPNFECEKPRNPNFPSVNPRNPNFECENSRNPNFECENARDSNFDCENSRNPNFELETFENTYFGSENLVNTFENPNFGSKTFENPNFGSEHFENSNFETNFNYPNEIDNFVDDFEIKMDIDTKNEKTQDIFFDNLKNPVAILNNIKNSTRYDLVEKSGRPHCPIFTVSVQIDENKYLGQGSSIKEAKNNAAKNALLFLQGKDLDLDFEKNKNAHRSIIKNSVSKLNEVRPGLVYNLVDRIGPSHAPIFTYSVNFDGNIFYGKGQNVKTAKQSAAEQVLRYLSLGNVNNEDLIMSDSENMTNELQPGDTTVHTTTGQKRSLEDSNDSNVPRKTQKIKEVPVNINGKNPVALLNELRPGLTYSILQKSGPVHAPIFTMSVTIDGQTYEGVGGNKKTAKARAAENALRSFIQFPHTNVDANSPNKNIDFTADDFAENNSSDKKVNLNFLAAFPKLKPQDLSKGPVMLLNEIYPGLKYTCVSSKEDTFEKFKTTVEVNGETFTGVGSSKKNSKSAAAKSALAKLLNVQQTPGMKNLTNADMPFTNVSVAQELTDYIGTLVCEKFSSLMVDDPTHSKRKVLAGIVMTKGDSDKGKDKDGEVICVTTGTKCVSGEHISMNGASLNDMHAEIVARRCLLDYLYDQLEMMADPEKSKESILVPRTEGEGYRLKDGIQFHLYINTAPCGDARIFSPHEELTNAVDRHPNRRARGQLRTKIESGEGTIPVKSSASMQTWDGILQGERLLTMSCSDKIARWNVLGLQGSLLSHFIEPIYLHTIVLGSLLHPVHMYRAICGRIENTVQGLPPPYRLNRPEMSLTTSSEVRRPIKAPNFSVNWTIGQIRHEVVNCLTGKTEQGVPSRLCKLAMFKRFLNVRNKVSSITGVHKEEVKESELMYGQAKNSVESYNIAKQNLGEAFVKADLGCWIKKPLEQDQFYVD